jgi:desulfoferrodoxin-like iron-binding protein
MSTIIQVLKCDSCGSIVEALHASGCDPECCGKPMRAAEKLPVCEMSTTAEHSRFTGNDDACDDGRSGT